MGDLVQVSLYVPKELDDVRTALVALVEDVKAGKPVTTLVAENLQNVLAAIAGADQIPNEFRQEFKESMGLAGLIGGQLLGALLAPKVTV